jgi:hypothetical protein
LRCTGADRNTLLLPLMLAPATLRAGMLLLLMTLMLLLIAMPKQKTNVASSSTTAPLPTARTVVLLSRLNRPALALGARRPCFLELVRSLLHLLLPTVLLLLLPAWLPVVLLVLALVVMLAAAAAGAACRAGWLRLVAPELTGLMQGLTDLSAARVFCAEPAEGLLLLLKPLLLLLLLLMTTLKVFSIADSK